MVSHGYPSNRSKYHSIRIIRHKRTEMQSPGIKDINIEIEVKSSDLLYSRVRLLKHKETFDELASQLLAVSISPNQVINNSIPTITVPSHPLLSSKQVKFLFRVVQYRKLDGQEKQLLRLEPVALFAGFYDVPIFLRYIKNTFLRGTLCRTSRAVLWLLRHKHLFEP